MNEKFLPNIENRFSSSFKSPLKNFNIKKNSSTQNYHSIISSTIDELVNCVSNDSVCDKNPKIYDTLQNIEIIKNMCKYYTECKYEETGNPPPLKKSFENNMSKESLTECLAY